MAARAADAELSFALGRDFAADIVKVAVNGAYFFNRFVGRAVLGVADYIAGFIAGVAFIAEIFIGKQRDIVLAINERLDLPSFCVHGN